MLETATQEVALPPPIREGLLRLAPPALLGTQCPACGTRSFPARDFCPGCATHQAPLPVALATEGTVHTYTVVHQAPGNRPTPYSLAYVDLDDGVRVLAQVDSPLERLRIGMRVTLVLRNVVPAPDEPRLGFAFMESTTNKENV
jgi:uncharacterized protein